jgi:hypothetical protein
MRRAMPPFPSTAGLSNWPERIVKGERMAKVYSILVGWAKRVGRWCVRPLTRRVLAAVDQHQAARWTNLQLQMLDFHARLTQQVADEITALSRKLESQDKRAA